MKQHSKWLALALAGALTLSLLAGCAGNEPPGASDSSSDTQTPQETVRPRKRSRRRIPTLW